MTFSRCILFLGGSLCEKSVPNWHNLHYDNDNIVSWNHQVTSLQIDLNYNDIIPTPRTQKTPMRTPFQCCFAVTFIAFTYLHFLCLISTLHTTLSLYHRNMCHHLSFAAHLTVVEIFICNSLAGLFILIRTPPLRFYSGTVWAGPGEPAPRPLTVLRGLCCPSYAHWHRLSSSPSLRPLPRHEKTQQLDMVQVAPHTQLP